MKLGLSLKINIQKFVKKIQANFFLLLEDSSRLLQEDGSRLII